MIATVLLIAFVCLGGCKACSGPTQNPGNTCPTLTVTNGQVTATGSSTEGDTATLSCHPYLARDPSAVTATCSGGAWSTTLSQCDPICRHGSGGFTSQSGAAGFVERAGHMAGVADGAACQAACASDDNCAASVFLTISAACVADTACAVGQLGIPAGAACFLTKSENVLDTSGSCKAQFVPVTGATIQTRQCNCAAGGGGSGSAESLLLGTCGVAASCGGGDINAVAEKLAQCGPQVTACLSSGGNSGAAAANLLTDCGLDLQCAGTKPGVAEAFTACETDPAACTGHVLGVAPQLTSCGLDIACLANGGASAAQQLLQSCNIPANCAGGEDPAALIASCSVAPGQTMDQLLAAACAA